LAVIHINPSQLQHLADAHASPGHELKHQTVSGVIGSEDDLFNRILFQDDPLAALRHAKGLFQHGGDAGIYEERLRGVLDEIEKGFQESVLEAPGGFCPSVSRVRNRKM
jgi:hypothetical protein